MNPQELITLIGNILTAIDSCLSSPDFPDTGPEWHQLYALRKALDDEQRALVAAVFQQESDNYESITKNLSQANDQLQTTIKDIQQVANTISTVTKIVGFVGQLLQLATT